MDLDVDQHFVQPARRFWANLSADEREQLSEQMDTLGGQRCLDHLQAALLLRRTINGNDDDGPAERYEPIDSSRFKSMATMQQSEKNCLFQLGMQAIANGQVAVVVLSGGQGTRLGSKQSKGLYDIGLPSGKTLYQLQAERILKLQSLATNGGCKLVPHIPWCVLVSESTQVATEELFQKHNYFGLSKCQVIFLCQDVMPCFDFDGHVLLDSQCHIAVAPNGNGGLYESLSSQRILDRLSDYGIRYVHVYSVDNVLVRVADPWFIGYCKLMDADCAVKTVERLDPREPLGVVCKCNGKPLVVEYSEISQRIAEQTDQNGRLLFRAGNIANHVFTLAFLQRIASENGQLPYHLATKKIAYINDNGNVVVPDRPNGYKLERFVFDVFPYAKNLAVVEVVRDEEFSALKNADSAGVDCPSTCRRDLYRLHSRWLGLTDTNAVCEVSPLVSYAGEGLEHVAKDGLQLPIHLELDGSG